MPSAIFTPKSSTTTRSAVLPDVPAISDTIAGFELVNFFGFQAPAGIPGPILKTLNTAAVQALNSPDMSAKLKASGFEPSPTTPEEFREFIRSESAKFAKIIADAGIKFEN